MVRTLTSYIVSMYVLVVDLLVDLTLKAKQQQQQQIPRFYLMVIKYIEKERLKI